MQRYLLQIVITAKVDKDINTVYKPEDAKKKIFPDLSTDEEVHGDPKAQKHAVMKLLIGDLLQSH